METIHRLIVSAATSIARAVTLPLYRPTSDGRKCFDTCALRPNFRFAETQGFNGLGERPSFPKAETGTEFATKGPMHDTKREVRFQHWVGRFTAPPVEFDPRIGAPGALAFGALWLSLRGVFLDAIGAVLMGDHFHVICPEQESSSTERRLRLAIPARQRRFRPSSRIQLGEIASRAIAPSKLHLARQLRYVALNPCRKGFTRDPLGWTWTTHRDVCGYQIAPWVTFERIRPHVSQRTLHDWHRYVSSDPDASMAGTPLHPPFRLPPGAPLHVRDSVVGTLGTQHLLSATRAALRRWDVAAFRKRGFPRTLLAAICFRLNVRDARTVADLVEVTPRGARYQRGRLRARPVSIEPVLRCLALELARRGLDSGRMG